MSEQKLFGVTAIFDTPNDIIHAAEKVRDSEYNEFDVHTPWPLHGMDPAMGLKPTKLPYVSLFMFLTGVGLGITFMGWTMAIDYPVNIGGKPMFSLPAFVPVFWAQGVLIGMLSTVIALLAIFCQLPNNNHPLHDTDYMREVSCERFGVCIESADPAFDEAKVKDFLTTIGGKDVASVYVKEVGA